ncbi:uncharacterized protein LOC144425654 [Styela clava]
MPVKSPHGILDIPEVPVSDFFLSRIKEYGEEIAMIDNTIEGKQLTFRQLYNQIQSCGRLIQKQGINKGDVVGLIVPNCLEYIVAMMGVISCVAVISPCNPSNKEWKLWKEYKCLADFPFTKDMRNHFYTFKSLTNNLIKRLCLIYRRNATYLQDLGTKDAYRI